ncbi:imidazole glycerol phosphate synthase subunit HisH [Emcibacter nanhaiensis]|uniref:Imidazole glycerol phosphate synthase subunit HisH n=1 Tax=Emcibacter nanhaiensis TaxID=1505037 RepID=A0A501PC05_9PROT|nr:imidazole glycerol phosphate synthase subunit HisH [Emcibacter nanhaiensis]TPD57414.1 imidazole glycerol phosphate synthase subunit HisH [Emcibacter nanhaiensis]
MITIVDYDVGNLGSVKNMLKRIGADSIITSSRDEILAAEKIILPGVGKFDHCAEKLESSGLRDCLEKKALTDKIPFLAICVGMQLLTKGSEEGILPGLGWIDAETRKFRFEEDKYRSLKIPHMGWNKVVPEENNPLFEGFDSENTKFYFCHSFHVICNSPENVGAKTNYGYEFSSAIRKENIFGVQFHPEKSHRYGFQLFQNFVGM